MKAESAIFSNASAIFSLTDWRRRSFSSESCANCIFSSIPIRSSVSLNRRKSIWRKASLPTKPGCGLRAL